MNGSPKRGRPGWLVYLALAVGAGAVVYALAREFPDALADSGNHPHLAYSLILLVVVGGSAIVGFRLRAGTMLRYALAWIAIGALAILAYSYRSEFRDAGNRIYGELRPDAALVTGDGEVTIRRGGDGHFRLTADVDGTPVRFLVDTGASVVALAPADARRLGFDTATLEYGMRIATANGTAWSAAVSLGEIVAGPIRARDVRAAVSRDGLRESLLGLSFLDRLSGYEVRRDTMILRP